MAIKPPVQNKKPSNILRLSLFWAIVVFAVLIFVAVVTPRDSLKTVPISQVINDANAGNVTTLDISGQTIKVTPKGSTN
jgi:hypothetical protein